MCHALRGEGPGTATPTARDDEMTPAPSSERHLRKLGELLVRRHLYVSGLGSTDRLHPELEPVDWAPGRRLDADRTRVVVVVGAGASAPYLPRGTALAEEVAQAADHRDLSQEIERLVRVYGMRKEGMETVLAAASLTPTGERRVRRYIARRFAIRHPTLVTYELIAHLAKHRFVDAVVSFNFDELLDQSMEDELGAGESRVVLSERDIPSTTIFDANDLGYVPLLVKPHGTASEPSGLRFTLNAYYDMPDEIREGLRVLVEHKDLVVINVGFGLQSAEFNYLLAGANALQVFDLSHTRVSKADLATVSASLGRKGDTSWYTFCGTRPRPKRPGRPKRKAEGCDILVSRLDRMVEECSIGAGRPRTVKGRDLPDLVDHRGSARHYLAAAVHPQKLATVPLSEDCSSAEGQLYRRSYRRYLVDRIKLEASLSAHRAKGLISIATLVHERVGHYFEHHEELRRWDQKSPGQFTDMIQPVGLIQSRDSQETFVLRQTFFTEGGPRSKKGGRESRDFKMGKVDLDMTAAVLDQVVQFDVEMLLPVLRERFGSGAGSLRLPASDDVAVIRRWLIRATLEQLWAGTEIEVLPHNDAVCSKVFRSPRVPLTLTGFKLSANSMLRRGDYDELLVIAETGEWLAHITDPKTRKRVLAAKITLITAFEEETWDLIARTPWLKGKKITVVGQQWFRHNRHMTIALRCGEPVGAFYLARRLRLGLVTPVEITERRDLVGLLQSFRSLREDAEAAGADG